MSARNDKRTYAENIATKAEREASRGDGETVYMLIEKLSGAQTNSYPFIGDKSGQLLTNQVHVQIRWSEYLSDVLSHPIPHELLLVPDVPLFNLDIY